MKKLVTMLVLLSSSSAGAAERVNLVALLARGDDFNGKEVYVSGYVCGRAESEEGLFLTLADCMDANLENGIRVITLKKEAQKREGRKTVQGIFTKDDVISTGPSYYWGKIEATTLN